VTILPKHLNAVEFLMRDFSQAIGILSNLFFGDEDLVVEPDGVRELRIKGPEAARI